MTENAYEFIKSSKDPYSPTLMVNQERRGFYCQTFAVRLPEARKLSYCLCLKLGWKLYSNNTLLSSSSKKNFWKNYLDVVKLYPTGYKIEVFRRPWLRSCVTCPTFLYNIQTKHDTKTHKVSHGVACLWIGFFFSNLRKNFLNFIYLYFVLFCILVC